MFRKRGGTKRTGRRWCCLAAWLLASGCDTVQVRYPDGRTEDQSREVFTTYVEAVFRHHNRQVNDLIVLTSFGGVEVSDELVEAERSMARDCYLLNDVVSATVEGRDPGLFQRLAMPEAVPRCEAASRRVEAMLSDI